MLAFIWFMGGFGNFFVPLLIGADKQNNIIFISKYRKICKVKEVIELKYSNKNNDFLLKYYNSGIKYNNKEITNVNINFNTYIAGLFEADGHITVNWSKTDSKDNIINIKRDSNRNYF